MEAPTGFDAQTPSLPEGGGAVSSLGETFTPDLSSGSGSYSIPLDCPNGPNDIGPRLALRYSSSSGNGPFGLGFALALPRLMRSTAHGFPRYDSSDRLMLEGAGELVTLGDGRYRPQVDAGAWRAETAGDGFRLTDREGNYYDLGRTAEGRLADQSGERIFAWHLEQIEDPLGNVAAFSWQRDRGQLYLASITYGAYRIEFHYTPRSDTIHWGRAGFSIITALRCASIELLRPDLAQPLLRRWSLRYSEDATSGLLLLTGMTMTGFDEHGQGLDAPQLQLGYTTFKPGELSRFQSEDDELAPAALGAPGRRIELVDWNGNGLPDLLEISPSGVPTRWPNAGELIWGRPQVLFDPLPLFASANAPVGLVDLDGDGVADLMRLDERPSGYIPRSAGGSFGPLVEWSQVPAVSLATPSVRLVDLDGDGRVDLMDSSADGFELYYRDGAAGWAEMPQQVASGQAPVPDLADRHIYLADMTGDGSSDLVRVDGGVTYWPYLGNGRWDEPVQMQHPPDLPPDWQPDRLFVGDVDGDGCADLFYLDAGQVWLWINRCGNAFSDRITIDNVPASQIGTLRLADMRGSGTAGILWAVPGPLGSGAQYFYLEFCAAAKPYLLNRIDNGLGLVTEVEYTTSALVAAADARKGQPWATFLPVPIPVISSMTVTEQTTGQVRRTVYHYRDGRYDGMLREFAGFAQVDQDEQGDESVPTLRTRTWFHVGIDPTLTEGQLDEAERLRLRAIRGRILRQERYGLDGSPQQDHPYDRLEQEWTVTTEDTAGGAIQIPRLSRSVRTGFEREDHPVTVLTTTNLVWDTHGNITEALQISELPGDPTQTRTLRTQTDFASDPRGRFLARPWRVRQFDGNGKSMGTMLTEYDDAPEGQVGVQGLVVRRSCLALTDEQAQEVYGAEQPDFAALGYYRRAGEQGWWCDTARYERIVDESGLHGRVTGSRGAVTAFDFDRDHTFPARVVDPCGNTIAAEHDYRVARIRRLVDAAGQEHLAGYDALARPLYRVEPGDTVELPTVSFEAQITSLPSSVTVRRRSVSGQAETIDGREFYDGAGVLLERRVRDATGELAVLRHSFNSRGMVARSFPSARAGSPAYTRPDPSQPHTAYTYDALGRITRQTNPDGSFRTMSYGPGWMEEADEEDTHTGAGATHQNTPTRTWFDPTGRIQAVEYNLGGRKLRSSYEYDLKGNLVRFTDANGNAVRLAYDCQGHLLQSERPESGTITVYNAAGDPVEVRRRDGSRILTEHDACRRPVAVRFGSPESKPVVSYTYHDAGKPAPSEAGEFSAGRCVRIDDQGGAVRFDYDAAGRVTRKRYQPGGSEHDYSLSFEYRADGRLSRLIYPDAAQTNLIYSYDPRGELTAVQPILPQIESDEQGRRTRQQYANGVEQRFAYDALRCGVNAIELIASGQSLYEVHLSRDLVGNVVRIDSPNPAYAGSYAYDDLYRLTSAQMDNGQSWTYAYDDAGNLTHKSDLGDYRYGEHGAPPTCLTSAGDWSFGYTQMGEMQETPWGKLNFDPLGRLAGIDAPEGKAEFLYNYTGQRVAEHRSKNGAASVTRLSPDPLFAVEDGRLVLHLYDGQGIVAHQVEGESPVYLHADHLGSLVAVTGKDGTLLDRLRYAPNGAVLERTGAGAALPVGFTGGLSDPDSGLLYLSARYYHPRLGRFISPDTLVQDVRDPLAWSPYTYCRNNPLLYVDPSGHSFWEALTAAITIVGLVAVSIATLGVGGLVIVGAGLLIGGLIGGLRAADKGGSFGDIVTGALVGAAAGGSIALAVATGGASLAAQLGTPGFWGGVAQAALNGAVNGALVGAGTGFVSGLAGGHGSFDAALNGMLQGALSGALAGAASGAVYGAINQVRDPQLQDMLRKSVSDSIQPPPSDQLSGASLSSLTDPSRWSQMAQDAATREVNSLRDTVLNRVSSQLNGSPLQSLALDTLSSSRLPGPDRLLSALNLPGPLRSDLARTGINLAQGLLGSS